MVLARLRRVLVAGSAVMVAVVVLARLRRVLVAVSAVMVAIVVLARLRRVLVAGIGRLALASTARQRKHHTAACFCGDPPVCRAVATTPKPCSWQFGSGVGRLVS